MTAALTLSLSLSHFRKVRRAQSIHDHETWTEDTVTNTLNAFDTGDVRAVDVVLTVSNDSNPQVFEDMTGALKVGSSLGIPSAPAVAYDEFNDSISDTHHTLRAGTKQATGVIAPTLSATNDPSRSPQSSEVTAQVDAMVQATSVVRRLTPLECERLQGFPDQHTAERFDFKKQAVIPQADSARYKQMGNAVAVPVFEWVMSRLVAAHESALPVAEEGAA